MTSVAFESSPLPRGSATLRSRLRAAHRGEPFRALDPRSAAQRVGSIARELGLAVTAVRGTLDLDGSEVDHIWLDVEGRVIDVAFPLFVPSFVSLLRGWVVGLVDAAELEAVAAPATLDERVLGEFPPPLRYRGEPVWSARH